MPKTLVPRFSRGVRFHSSSELSHGKAEQRSTLDDACPLGGAAVGLGILIYFFANFREERAVQKCFEALQNGDLPAAYQIWGPTKEYTYQDFLKDWGEGGYFGRVRNFQIVDSKSTGSGVIVRVQIKTDEGQLRIPIAFWVERKDLTIGFSPTDF